MKRIAVVFGTRPEAIKLMPLIIDLKKVAEVIVVFTGQHQSMADEIFRFFDISANFTFKRGRQSVSLPALSGEQLTQLCSCLDDLELDGVIVQGDTTSALSGATYGRLRKLAVYHVEAGLRSFDSFDPFPEELNRKCISIFANYHFCPTSGSKNNLALEGICQNVFVVGNTVVDAQKIALTNLAKSANHKSVQGVDGSQWQIDGSQKFFVFTCHRREALESGNLKKCIENVKIFQRSVKDFFCILPVHKNPTIRSLVAETFDSEDRVCVCEPLSYPDFILCLSNSSFIVSDSGGVQEEAVGFMKPLLITRDKTERPEVFDTGISKLVGQSADQLLSGYHELKEIGFSGRSGVENPFGEGNASAKIVDIINRQ